MLLLPPASFPSLHLPYRYTVYLSEARKRLIYAAFSLFLAFLCAYTERVALLYLIAFPLQKTITREGQVKTAQWENVLSQQESSAILLPAYSCRNENGGVELIFTDVEEAFYTLLSISLFWCLLACLPVFIYHAWCFLQPGVSVWQSQRARAFLYRTVLFVYLLLWFVNQYVLARLVCFFYGFEIERTSLSLHAEIKVVSYVSLYLFVNFISLALCLSTVVWRLYIEKQILHSLRTLHFSTERSSECELSRDFLARPGNLSFRYQYQRSKLWWGCLLVSGILSPPEISSQLLCALLLIFLNELALWLAYISSCRLEYQMRT